MYKKLSLLMLCSFLIINIHPALKGHNYSEQQKWENIEELFVAKPIDNANDAILNSKVFFSILAASFGAKTIAEYYIKQESNLYEREENCLPLRLDPVLKLRRNSNLFITFFTATISLFLINYYEKKYLRNHLLYQEFLEFIKNWPSNKSSIPECLVELFDKLYENYLQNGEINEFKKEVLILLRQIQNSIYHKFSYKYYQPALFNFNLF